MPSPLSGFDDTVELALEPIYGLRVFFTRSDGLRSIHWDYTWAPGLNKDFCFTTRSIVVPKWDIVAKMRTETEPVDLETAYEVRKERIGWEEHDMVRCSCGFYAYHSQVELERQYDDLLHLPSTVLGVIKGTGNVILGEKGFRAEKAEVVALAPARGSLGNLGGIHYSGQSEIRYWANRYQVPYVDSPRDLREKYPPTFQKMYDEKHDREFRLTISDYPRIVNNTWPLFKD